MALKGKTHKFKQPYQSTSNVNANAFMIQHFNEFISDKESIGLVADTIRAYKVTYEKFTDYFDDRAELAGDIHPSMFREWRVAMRAEGLAAATVNHHLGGIRAFMYWCMDTERSYLPYFKIQLTKSQEEPPKDYTIEEVTKLLKMPTSKKFTEWRSWLVASFVIGTGARLSTVIEIRMCDIDWKNSKVHYRHTKNKKVQLANIPPQLLKSLEKFKGMWRKNADDEEYLFCTVSGDKMSRHSLKAAYSKYANDRGVKKTSMHGLRHTFAREWYLNGGDVIQLSKILGHSTIKMSERYMNIYADTAQDKFNQFNPLENITKSRGRARKGVQLTE